MIKILLFYKYIDIANPEGVRDWQKELCQMLDLKGRIWIAHEGINGTVGGSQEAINQYVAAMRQNQLFYDIDFKESTASAAAFPKLKVKARPEIVRLGVDPHQFTAKEGGVHLTPQQAHELIQKKPHDLLVFDARNAFEAKIGKFENALVPDIEYFRELPRFIDENLETFKEKQVLMYCTGGIRCERASAYLKSKNVAKEVFQLEGGIHKYVEQFPDGFFRGKNYVFDGRVAMRVNNDILSNCELCGTQCDDYTNCINTFCNKQFVACQPCLEKTDNTCSANCQKLVKDRSVVIRSKAAKTSDTHGNGTCSIENDCSI